MNNSYSEQLREYHRHMVRTALQRCVNPAIPRKPDPMEARVSRTEGFYERFRVNQAMRAASAGGEK